MPKINTRIIGIKAIANYLDVSAATVHRWERELGMPLHRVGSGKGSSVFAYVDELEEWLADSGGESVKHGGGLLLGLAVPVAAGVVILAVVVLFFTLSPDRQSGDSTHSETSALSGSSRDPGINAGRSPDTFVIEDGVVYAKDNKGNVLWSYRITNRGDVTGEWLRRCTSLADIDDDGFMEIGTPTYDLGSDRFFLCLFKHNGEVIWKNDIKCRQTFNGVKLSDKFVCVRVVFACLKEEDVSVVAIWHHQVGFLSIIASYDLEGELLCRYLHIGHLEDLKPFDLDGDGDDEILFAGTNILLDGEGIIGVLPARSFHGISPPYLVEPEYAENSERLSIYIPDDPVPGNQLLYIRFKVMEHLLDYRPTFSFAKIGTVNGESINVFLNSIDYGISAADLCPVFVFDNRFDLKYVFPNNSLTKRYPEFLRNGDVSISLVEFLEEHKRSVHRWDDGRWVPLSK